MYVCSLLYASPHHSVFSTIVFAAMNVGQSSSLAPDMGKAQVSAQRIMKLLERKPAIDSYSEDGEKLVRKSVLFTEVTRKPKVTPDLI